jgi:hypothetical protein
MRYEAVVNGTDPVRVTAIDEAHALRQIARLCEPGETISFNGVQYVVNGKLAAEAVSRV